MSDSAEQSRKSSQAQAIVEEVIARRRRGEVISDEQVLQLYPELLGTLERLLRKAAMLESLRPAPHPLEQLLNRIDNDPELAAGPSDDPPANDNPADPSVLPLPGNDQETAHGDDAHADLADEEFDLKRITIDESTLEAAAFADANAGSSKTRPQATPSDATWSEPALAGNDELTAKLFPSPLGSSVAPYRPTARPPMALLRVLDDDQRDGEVVRLRASEVTIGRDGADVCLPHDPMISLVHARIERVKQSDGWRWTLRDLGSTNGVFVKARKIKLRDGDQLVIANRIVQFRQAEGDNTAQLHEVTPDGPGESLDLSGADCFLGRDASACAPFLADEATLDRRLARVTLGSDGRWSILSSPSINGVWVRLNKIDLVDGSMFQLGEQRFSFHTS
ncbi:MAG: FHA domain-containing protein [Planctomycetota bacterium]